MDPISKTMTWETCGMSIPRPITSVATNRRNSPFRNRSKVFNLDSWSQCRRHAETLFFVTGKPNKKNGSTQTKKSFRDVRVSWWGFMEISWWFWSQKSVIRKEGFYGQISWPWGRHSLRSISSCSWSPRNLWKREDLLQSILKLQSNGFFEVYVLKKL